IQTNDGNDRIDAAAMLVRTTIDGGDGNDTILGGAEADTIDAGNGDNSVVSGDGADFITCGSGDDTVDGGREGGTINTGDGNDSIRGGDDAGIGFGYGFDQIDAGEGDNVVHFTSGSVVTGNGDDTITVDQAADAFDSGNVPSVTIQSGDGDDSITT